MCNPTMPQATHIRWFTRVVCNLRDLFRYGIRVLATGAFLSGCASGPDYQLPTVDDSAVGPFVSRSGTLDTDQSVPAQWWRLYDDVVLNGLVSDALLANTDLRVAQANLERARAIYGETRSGLLPATDVSAGARYGRDQTSWSGSGQAPKQWVYTGGLDVAYEVDLFGRVRRDIEAARYDTEVVAARLDAARVIVVAETTRAYLDVCTLGDAIDVTKASIELAQRSRDIVVEKERRGAASRMDVNRADVSLAQAQAELPVLRGQRQSALFELAALLGKPPSQVPDVARGCIKAPDINGSLPVGDGSALLRRRPDIRQAERELAADTARIGVAVAALYPQISLGASVNYLRNDDLKGDRSFSFGVGPLISWHFPNTSVARRRVEQSKAQASASLAAFDGVVLAALKETEQALSAYDATLEQRKALIEARDQAENAFKLAELRYHGGAIGYLHLIVAQSTFIDARSRVVAVDQQVASARVSVFKALGGGWGTGDDESEITEP
ncbi:efflux transporter outer membrane subunit [Zhongshania sp. BJYM1]|uniref:efflux transporter outer membrane subunit n=1 Tax=Zhongshania aquatica TaxID=2965069 RepID=UPI0022B2FBED|nr:TolC family protein [Marortus sp. BJYM1]